MTSQEPPPNSDPNSPTQGLPSYGSVPPPPPGGSYPPPPPPPSGYPPPAPGGYGAAPQTNQKALWSMILGIVGLVCCGLFAGIPAIVLSTMAKKEIAASGGREGGAGMATAGLILGIVSIAFSIIGTIFYVILIASSGMGTYS